MTVPEWVQDAVFYQIFPDRFANGGSLNDPANVLPWDAPPTLWKFHGGDLQGVIQKFDYLLDLGITAIYHDYSNHLVLVWRQLWSKAVRWQRLSSHIGIHKTVQYVDE